MFVICQFRSELLLRRHNISRQCGYNQRRGLAFQKRANGDERGLPKTLAVGCGDLMQTRYWARTSCLPDIAGNPPEQSPLGGPWKRAFDLSVGGIALITLTPILLGTAGLIRLLLGRPIVVSEDRVGYKGRTFKCYAFRTTDRDSDGGRVDRMRSDGLGH